jgi:hypothetical protein
VVCLIALCFLDRNTSQNYTHYEMTLVQVQRFCSPTNVTRYSLMIWYFVTYVIWHILTYVIWNIVTHVIWNIVTHVI